VKWYCRVSVGGSTPTLPIWLPLSSTECLAVAAISSRATFGLKKYVKSSSTVHALSTETPGIDESSFG